MEKASTCGERRHSSRSASCSAGRERGVRRYCECILAGRTSASMMAGAIVDTAMACAIG